MKIKLFTCPLLEKSQWNSKSFDYHMLLLYLGDLSSLAGKLILILIPIEQWLMFLIGQIVSIAQK